MFCKECGFDMKENASICIKCGVSKTSKIYNFCSECGKKVGENAVVCIHCGVALSGKQKRWLDNLF